MGQETKCGPVVSVLVADNVEVPRPSPALTTSSPTSCIGRICFIVDLINLFTSSIYQLFWTQANPEGMCTNGTQVPCEVPSLPNPTTRKGWPHHRGLRPLLFSNSDGGSLRPTRTNQWKCCEMGPTVSRPYQRRLERLTICRCHYKGSTFFSVI